MKKLILVSIIFVLLIGCDYLQPDVEKSKTEKKQLIELRAQNEVLIRIAEAIERIE